MNCGRAWSEGEGFALSETFRDRDIVLVPCRMGQDLNVSLSGGDRAHIGAVAVSEPRPSSQDPSRTSATTSVITLGSHKEDVIARAVSRRLAARLGVTVTVACGIHFDDLHSEDIPRIQHLVDGLIDRLITILAGPEG